MSWMKCQGGLRGEQHLDWNLEEKKIFPLWNSEIETKTENLCLKKFFIDPRTAVLMCDSSNVRQCWCATMLMCDSAYILNGQGVEPRLHWFLIHFLSQMQRLRPLATVFLTELQFLRCQYCKVLLVDWALTIFLETFPKRRSTFL